MPTKSTQTTVQKRVKEILSLRLLGAEFADIVQYASEQKWKIGERQLRNYIAEGDKLLADTLEKTARSSLTAMLPSGGRSTAGPCP
jgi:hypothetical protein